MSDLLALIIDDSPSARFILSRYLDRLRWHSRSASTMAEALQLLQTEKPNLIFVDYRLHEVEPRLLINTLGDQPGGQGVPIVLCIADEPSGFIDSALASGAAAVIEKPISMSDIVALLGTPPEGLQEDDTAFHASPVAHEGGDGTATTEAPQAPIEAAVEPEPVVTNTAAFEEPPVEPIETDVVAPTATTSDSPAFVETDALRALVQAETAGLRLEFNQVLARQNGLIDQLRQDLFALNAQVTTLGDKAAAQLADRLVKALGKS